MDKIFIEALQAQAVIGVYDFEKEAPQPLIFDFELGLDIEKAMASDDLNDTVDYKAFADFVRDWLMSTQFELLEKMLAELLSQAWQKFPAIKQIRVKVKKPMAVENAVVGIELLRSRPV